MLPWIAYFVLNNGQLNVCLIKIKIIIKSNLFESLIQWCHYFSYSIKMIHGFVHIIFYIINFSVSWRICKIFFDLGFFTFYCTCGVDNFLFCAIFFAIFLRRLHDKHKFVLGTTMGSYYLGVLKCCQFLPFGKLLSFFIFCETALVFQTIRSGF